MFIINMIDVSNDQARRAGLGHRRILVICYEEVVG